MMPAEEEEAWVEGAGAEERGCEVVVVDGGGCRVDEAARRAARELGIPVGRGAVSERGRGNGKGRYHSWCAFSWRFWPLCAVGVGFVGRWRSSLCVY